MPSNWTVYASPVDILRVEFKQPGITDVRSLPSIKPGQFFILISRESYGQTAPRSL